MQLAASRKMLRLAMATLALQLCIVVAQTWATPAQRRRITFKESIMALESSNKRRMATSEALIAADTLAAVAVEQVSDP